LKLGLNGLLSASYCPSMLLVAGLAKREINVHLEKVVTDLLESSKVFFCRASMEPCHGHHSR
jgi:hypothetical protein